MINKINSLTKIFFKSSYQDIKIFNKKNKTEKKSLYFWMISVLAIGIFFISYKSINFFVNANQKELFLNLYFIAAWIFLSFQMVLISTNIFFYSKDIEYILPMPVTQLELLISKFNTMVFSAYMTEAIFGLIPLLIYGMMTQAFINYYVLMFIVLIIFPILIALIISICTLLLMNLSRIIKNQHLLQSIITFLLIIIVFSFQLQIFNGFSEVNSYFSNIEDDKNIDSIIVNEKYGNLTKGFLIINPSIEILREKSNVLDIVLNISKLLGYNLIAIIIFLIIGRISYIKNILRNISEIKNKNKKIVKLKNKNKKILFLEFIKKDIKNLFRHPIFFIQTVLPAIILIITIINLGVVFIPIFKQSLEANVALKEVFESVEFDYDFLSMILIIIQVLFSFSTISLTAISREGRDAILIKYIPVDLYKQFLYKNSLQIILNTIVTVVALGCIYYLLPTIGFINIILLFIGIFFINLINSFLMLIVDLMKPNLNWDSEFSALKRNNNKLFQYVLMIIMILIYIYLSKIGKIFNISIALMLIIEIIVFFIAFLIINLIIKKNINKLFSRIK